MVHRFESSNQHLKLTSLVVWAVILSIPKFQNHQSQTLSLRSWTWNMGETCDVSKTISFKRFFQRNLYWKVKFRFQRGSQICQASTWTGCLGQGSSQWRYHGTIQFGPGILSLLDRKKWRIGMNLSEFIHDDTLQSCHRCGFSIGTVRFTEGSKKCL